MKKENQKVVNELCIKAVDDSIEYMNECGFNPNYVERLRTCQAWILHYDRYDILRSYETYVAIYDKETDTFYDVLRYVWGSSRTSARQITWFYRMVSTDSACQPSLLRYYDR